MILEALYQMAQDEGLVDDPDFEVRPVTWLVDVGEDGTCLGVRGTRTEITEGQGRRTRTRLVARSLRIPRQPGRTSGDRAFFLVDKPDYSLRLYVPDPAKAGADDHPERRRKRADLFLAQVQRCADATGDAGVSAVAKLLQRIGHGTSAIILPAEAGPGDLCAFVYHPDVDVAVHARPTVERYWREQRRLEAAGGEAGALRCMITGTPMAVPGNFPPTKRIPGANPKGGTLVSFNQHAFESFNLSGNANAPLSRAAAEACGAALSRLFDQGFRRAADPGTPLARRRIDLGGDTVVGFWAARRGPSEFVDLIAALLAVDEPGRVGDAYRSVWTGSRVRLDDPSEFYGLTLSGAQGRVVVRDWFESTVARVADNLSRHFADLAVVRNTPAPTGGELPPALPLRALLGSLAPRGDTKAIPAPLVTAFVSAALRGARYPISLLQRAIERARAEIAKSEWADLERRDARAALIKAVLIRHFNRRLTPDMDPANTQTGYLLGRLIAVIERLQQVALGPDVNATVVDRYFAAASATPRAVFTRLLRNARHHVRKAADEPKTAAAARWLDNQIDAIASRFDPARNGFPAHLDLEQQALFVLGYHQQRHFLWMSKDERAATNAREQATPNQAA